ncbi:MAG: efflux RND transporter periplasmic adaptor subunit [Chloroflexota bacterium]
MPRWNLWRILAVVPVLALAACRAPANGPQTPTAKNAITVAETTATVGSIASILSYSGSVTPRWTVSIVPLIAGQVTDLNVQAGQVVRKGDVIAVLDHRTQDDQLATARANLASAQAKLNSIKAGARPEDVAAAKASAAAAQAAVSALENGRPSVIVQAQANLDAAKAKLAEAQAGGRPQTIAQAQAKLDADQAGLDKLQNGPTPQDVTNAKLAIEQAKDRLYSDQTLGDRQVSQGLITQGERAASLAADQTAIDSANNQLAKLLAPPRPEDLAQARAAVAADQQALALARQPDTAADIAQLKAAVDQAQSALDQARQPGSAAAITQARQQAAAQEASATKTAQPYTTNDIAEAEAGVAVAQAGVQTAQSALADTTISAPAAGIISDVPVAPGSLVGANSPIATLISPNLEVDVSVEQGQVGLFKGGQTATITAGGSPIAAKVFEVAPTADAQTRKFTVKVAPTQPASPLRAGMSATVSITTGGQQNAVLIPKDSIIQRGGEQVVFTDVNGRAAMSTVQTGLSDDRNIQITSGLKAGARVILPGSLDLADGDAVVAAPGLSATPVATPAASPSPSQPSPVAAKSGH